MRAPGPEVGLASGLLTGTVPSHHSAEVSPAAMEAAEARRVRDPAAFLTTGTYRLEAQVDHLFEGRLDPVGNREHKAFMTLRCVSAAGNKGG